MDIKEKLAKIREVVGDDKAGEISPFLSEIQSEFISLDNDNKANIRESMGRKDKLRAQENEIHDLKADNDTLKDDTKIKALQTENDTLKAFQTQVHGDTRKNLIARVESYKENEKFAEVRDNLGLATKTEKIEGKDVIVFDPESMDAAAVSHSLGKIMEYESLKVFGENGDGPIDSNAPNAIRDKTVVKTDDVDLVKLVKTDPAAAAKILASQGLGHRSFNPS